MNRLIAIAAAVLVLAGGAYVWQSGQQNLPYPSLGMAEAQEATAEIDTSMVEEMVLGNPDAAVTVVEYASYTCPHCKDFHQDTFKDLKANYIDTDKIKFVYREVYFDRFGLWAAMVARCGGTERYFGIADMIYAQQSEWTAGETPADIAGNLAKIGRTAGLGAEEVDACLQDGEMAQAMVAVYQENAEADGIRSTPTLVINGESHSNMPYAELAALLDEKLAE